MKLVLALVCLCTTGILADDTLWMHLMSQQIMEAVHVADDKNIPALAGDLNLNLLVTFLKAANLVDALSAPGPFTVFGPTDAAFKKLPAKFVDFLKKNTTVLGDILKYHVASGEALSTDLKNDMLVPSLQGQKIRINIYKDGKVITASGRQVTLPDQKATNGVIHEVSGVLFPPPGTITYAVAKCPVFSTLLAAVKAADLASTLDGAGPFTLFAPSDKAFARIPKKCLDALLKDKKKLTQVLTYHVVPSTAYSAGLSCGDEVKTVEGGNVKITIVFGKVRVNYAKVTYADGTATNGVIHVIDRVLFPKGFDNFCSEDIADYDDSSSEGDTFLNF